MAINQAGNTRGARVKNWNDIKKEIAVSTPKERDFRDVYSDEIISKDLSHVNRIKRQNQIGAKNAYGMSDSKVQEYILAGEITNQDYFMELERTKSGNLKTNLLQTPQVYLTSDYDDFCNHIDAVCVINNEFTGGKPLPFALDMTYNNDYDDLGRKFGWAHPYKNVGLPGFATVKYFPGFNDANAHIPKGKIKILPRFVIGVSSDITNELGQISVSGTAWDEPRREELTERARYVILDELYSQASRIKKQLAETAYDKQDPLMRQAEFQIDALEKYFGGALEMAKASDTRGVIKAAEKDRAYMDIDTQNFLQGRKKGLI